MKTCRGEELARMARKRRPRTCDTSQVAALTTLIPHKVSSLAADNQAESRRLKRAENKKSTGTSRSSGPLRARQRREAGWDAVSEPRFSNASRLLSKPLVRACPGPFRDAADRYVGKNDDA